MKMCTNDISLVVSNACQDFIMTSVPTTPVTARQACDEYYNPYQYKNNNEDHQFHLVILPAHLSFERACISPKLASLQVIACS